MVFKFTAWLITIVLFLVFWPCAVCAAPPLELTNSQDIYELPLYLDFFEDPSNELTISDVSLDRWSDKFIANTERNPKFEFSSSARWARLKIKNSSYQFDWTMAFLGSTPGAIDNIDVYISDGEGVSRYVFGRGNSIFESQKPYRDDNAIFPLYLPVGRETTLYFRIQDEALTLLHLYLYTPTAALQFNRLLTLWDVLLLALILFFIFNLLLFLSLRDKVFLFCCFVLVSEGLIYALPEMPRMSFWWMNRLRGVVYIANAIAWLFIIKMFFQNMRYSEQVNALLHVFLLVFGFLIFYYFALPFDWMAKSSAYVFVAYAIMLMSLSLFSWVKGLAAARYFSTALILLAFCWCGFYLDLLGYISLNFWGLIYLKALKSTVVFLFFSFALLDRYKLAENAMRQNQAAALERMQQADQLKDDFLANTSHELRTPLHGIIGLSENLLSKSKGAMEAEWEESISLIIRSGKRLSKLIDDILDFSRIKQNDIHVAPRPMDFKSVCSLVMALCRPMIGEKPIEIRAVLPEQLPCVLADEDRLQQILLNLLGNAIKFTHRGEIIIRAEVFGRELRVTVQDSGIGIPEENLESIFKEFTQVDGTLQREYGGTGLGLAITKKLIELQGGAIRVESEVNKGSVFYFSLPLAEGLSSDGTDKGVDEMAWSEMIAPEENTLPLKGHPQSKPTQLPNPDLSKKILIVDDDAVGIYILENHLSSMGYHVCSAQDGFAAWEKVQKESFDLAILDIMMPRINGYELCDKIRTLYDLTELPVIMLTAKTRVGDITRAFDCGANDYVTKPVNREELLSRIKTSLQLKQFADLLRENQTLKDEIIKRKIVEKDLSSVNRRLIGLLDIWETGLIVMDPNQNIQFFNQRAEKLFCRQTHEVFSCHIHTLLPDLTLPTVMSKSHQMNVTAAKPDNTSIPLEIIVTPIDMKGDMAYALLCRNVTTTTGLENKVDISDELIRTHQKIQILQSAFDSALQFLDKEGKQLTSELKNVESTMKNEFAKLPENEIESLFRQTMVDVMVLVLEAWERVTGKNKIQFAEESGIWNVYLDADSYKTRTLDKYLDIKKLPNNPRWKDVIKSAEFISLVCPETNPFKNRLQASLSRLRALAKIR
jgi:two-component system sensor histidine kinase ChiS